MDLDNQGEFGGLGIQITTVNGELTVKEPIEDTPAFRAGLKADDKIVRIENYSTINMDLQEAVSLLRGEVGSAVNIMVMRKGWSKPRLFNIIRGRIKIDPVKGEQLDDGIGYVRIQAFNANVAEDLKNFLTKFDSSNNFNGLILDLRSNPGGYLDQAFKVADMFLDSGVIVSTVEGSQRSRDELLARGPNSFTDIPIVILVNGSSASASEIVAGAIRNRNRGIIVGERTFGKGSVQHLYPNPDGSQLKLTVAQYLTPGDRSIQSVGIPPDVYLEQSTVQASEFNAEPIISLYWREWLQREADLDRHLENEATLQGDVTYRLRYLVPKYESGVKPKPKDDWEVQFAQRLLAAAPIPERAKQLQGIGSLITEIQQDQSEELRKAFSSFDIDWSNGNAQEAPNLEINLQEPNLILDAGLEEQLEVTITNNGSSPIHQLSLLTSSDNPALDHQEFYVGKIGAGESMTVSQTIQLPYGYGSEVSNINIEARTPENREILFKDLQIETKAQSRPHLAADLRFSDKAGANTRGNGNGIPEKGEVIAIKASVTNNGTGPTRDAFLRIKNLHRKSLDIIEGVIEVGEWQNDEGTTCEANSEGCFRKLGPGQTTEGEFLVELREDHNEAWEIEVLMGDNRAYDYDSIMRGGFSDYFMQKYPAVLNANETLKPISIQPPLINIRTDSPMRTTDDAFSLSGIVSDEVGLQELIVFHNEDKIYYRSESADTKSAPFSADFLLEDGLNHIHILAKNSTGLHHSTTVNVWKE